MADTYKIKNITVRQKIATGDDTYIVCGNSDYTIHWDLDDEWAEYNEKTMLVLVDNSPNPYPIQFTGTDAALPALLNTRRCVIGLMAGDVRTTTGAMFVCLPSVRDASGAPVEPPADVYAQLAAQLAGKISEPSEDGTAGQALITDGKGGRSWGDVASTPDWDQNDPTAKDYVKNRTHYVEKDVSLELIRLVDADLSPDDASANEVAEIPPAGAAWTAVFDGETYSGTTVESVGAIVCGNLSIKNMGDDTGEPFVVAMFLGDGGNIATVFVQDAGTHTMTLSVKTDVVHTIDPKYIKDMYYTEKQRIGGVGFAGWVAVTNLEAVPIPELVIAGTVYTNVEVSDYSSVEVDYTVGGYRLNFSRRNSALTVSPLDSGLSDSDVEVYGEKIAYHRIPDQYMPEWVIRIPEASYENRSRILSVAWDDAINSWQWLAVPAANIVEVVKSSDNLYELSDFTISDLASAAYEKVTILQYDSYLYYCTAFVPGTYLQRYVAFREVTLENTSKLQFAYFDVNVRYRTIQYYDWADVAPEGVDGITPHIGDNGNWYLGDTDTGVAAKGEKGDKGDKGDTGATGPAGPAGSDASVTAANITAALGYAPAASGLGVTGATAGKLLKIAAVDANGVPTKIGTGNAVSAAAPTFAADTAAMTDTSKVYIGVNGHLWAYQQSTEQQATAENVFSKSGVQLNVRLKSNGVDTSAQAGMTVSDFIPVDLSTDPFWVWFKGWNLKASEDWPLYTKVYYYDASKAYLGGYDMGIPPATLNRINMIEDGDYRKFKAGYAETTDMDASTEAKLSFYSNIKYIRFNMLVVPGSSSPAAATDANLDGIEIYLNQDPNETSEVVTSAWVDTGITYAQTALTQADKEAIAEIVLEQLGSPYVTAANVLKMPGSGTVVYADTKGTLADTEPIGGV